MNRIFDRIEKFDERSRAYPIRTLVADKKPRSYTWRCDAWLNQGTEGACHDADTEVLTGQGWQLWRDLDERSELASVDPVTKALSYIAPLRTIKRWYCGPMIVGKSRAIDFMVTPDHKMLLRKWDEKARTLAETYAFVDASDIGWYAGLMSTVVHAGIDSETYCIPGVPAHSHSKYKEDLRVDMRAWLKFLGIFLAEGTLCRSKKSTYRIQIAAVKERERSFVREVADALGFGGYWVADRYVFGDARVWLHLQSLGVDEYSYNKQMPEFVFSLSSDLIQCVIDGHKEGDGHQYESGMWEHTTTSRKLADGLQRAYFLCGKIASIKTRGPRLGGTIDGRTISGKRDCHSVREYESDKSSIERGKSISVKDYEGYVYCAEVAPHHTLVTRRNGKILISGNCTGFSLAHEAAGRPIAVSGLTNQTARDIYLRAQQIDEWPGENYSGSSVLAAMKAGMERGWYSEYRWAFGETDLALAIGYKGPAILGVPWYEGMSQPDASGRIAVTGRVVGGHAILCNGYNHKRREYRLHNSWGRDWSVNGECTISAADMARLLSEQGEACIPIKRTKGPK